MKIIVEPCAGLGNRFLSMASAYHWAVKLGAEFEVLWKAEAAMGAPAKAIFTLPDNVKLIELTNYGYKADLFGQIKYNNAVKRAARQADKTFEIEKIMDIYEKSGSEGIYKALTEGNPKTVYIRSLSQFYDVDDMKGAFDFIKPSKRVTRRIESIIGDVAGRRLVGVHIRRTDNVISMDNSPLELFKERMNEELKADAATVFYLATDSKEVEADFKETFGDKIITFKDKSFTRDDEQGIVDAYTEILCLARSEKILGSFYSTFSRMAAMMGGIPLEIVKK